MSLTLNRRQWLKAAGATLAATALAPHARLSAQTPAPAAAPRRPLVAPGLIRLNYNENPFGPAASAQEAMRAAIPGSFRYADAEERDLVALIAARENCRPEQIVLGAGSGEILDAAGFLFGLEQGEIVAGHPSYLALLNAADRVGGKAIRVPLNARLEHDLPAMAAAVTPRRGRLGFEEAPYPQRPRLLGVLAAVQSVVTRDIAAHAAAHGLVGPQVGQLIHQARIEAVAQWLHSSATPD